MNRAELFRNHYIERLRKVSNTRIKGYYTLNFVKVLLHKILFETAGTTETDAR